MADAEASGTPGKGAWSDTEKYSLLLQIIKQTGGDKLSINWGEISLPGRTPKAMTHIWAKIKAETVVGGASDGTPKPVVTPRKRAPKAAANGETPTKKKATPRKKKQVEQEVEQDADMTKPKDEASDDGAMKAESDMMDHNALGQNDFDDA